MKLLWLSDLHLEFLSQKEAEKFLLSVAGAKPDAVLFTGDISTASRIAHHLYLVGTTLPCPVYFVLGNHDFYGGSFAEVQAVVRQTCAAFPSLIHLGHGEIVALDAETSLIGHAGWADGRAGAGSRSTVRLNDSKLITDLRLETRELFALMEKLGDESADYIREVAPKALAQRKNLIIGTHVPPFVEASLYQNKPSGPDYAPHFVNLGMGRALREVAQTHPEAEITVLCGHTHHLAHFQPLPHLIVQVAGAEYANPRVAGVFTFSK